MNQNILFIDMDVYKRSIEIAVSDGGTQGICRYGKVGGAEGCTTTA